jgi:hypothetical protein
MKHLRHLRTLLSYRGVPVLVNERRPDSVILETTTFEFEVIATDAALILHLPNQSLTFGPFDHDAVARAVADAYRTHDV